jgi:hypothetical protein
MWLAGDNSQPEWRLALIDPQTGERLGFASLEALMEFLQARMEAASPFLNRSMDKGEPR